ncbi:hypothetical protein L1887_05727 [Cichorium endivia]|nr:hypothetical protein L1887_05727 [Cichorium endivia]
MVLGSQRSICAKCSLLIQMDICSHISFPVNDVKSLHGFCMGSTFESSYGLMGGFSVDELSYQATKFLNIQDDLEGVSCSIPPSHEKDVFQLKDELITHCSNVPSLPKPLKPVSAMKGSREKRGVGPPKKLTVKWAPDVYDPVPCSALDMVINRPRKHGKKKETSSKEKNNGSKSSSRGSKRKGKDKKQSRKKSGKSSD